MAPPAQMTAVPVLQRRRPGARVGLIDLYLLRALTPPLALCFGLVFVAMILERTLRLIDEMAQSGAHLGYLGPILLSLTPYYLALALPAAFAIALLLTVATLDEGAEIEVMMAAGRSLTRIVLPFVAAGVALGVVALVDVGYLQPHAWYDYRRLKVEAAAAGLRARLHDGAIQTRGGDVVVTADQSSAEGKRLTGVFISRTDPRGESLLIGARSGYLTDRPGGLGVGVTLDKGFVFREGPGHSPQFVRFERNRLDEPALAIPAPHARGIDQKELTLRELAGEMTSPRRGVKPYAVSAEFCGRLARSGMLVLLPLLALPLGMAAKRGGRVVGMVFAVTLLSVFQHGLNVAQNAGARGAVDPILAIGAVFGLFAVACGWVFISSRASPGAAPLAALSDLLRSLSQRIPRPRAARTALGSRAMSGYVVRTLAVWTLVAFLTMMTLLQTIDLLERSGEILDRGLGWQGVARYALLRLPDTFEQSIGLSSLAGAVLAFLQLSRSSEIVAMRAAGVSLYQVVGMALPVALGVAVLGVAVGQGVSPGAQQELSRWWMLTARGGQSPPPLWFRVRQDLVSAAQVSADGGRIDGMTVYRRNALGDLIDRTVAKSAQYDGRVWRLHDAAFTQFADAAPQSTIGEYDLALALAPADLARLASRSQLVSAHQAWRSLTGKAPTNLSKGAYETAAHRALAAPLVAVVMLLLGAPLAFSSPRTGPPPALIIFALGTGLVYVVADGVLTVMAQTQLAPSWVGAWSAFVVFALLAATVIVYEEA